MGSGNKGGGKPGLPNVRAERLGEHGLRLRGTGDSRRDSEFLIQKVELALPLSTYTV